METGKPAIAEWLSDFELGNALGAQTHTVTYRARRRHDDRPVLVRASNASRRQAVPVRRAMAKERDVLRAVGHPAIPGLLDVVEQDDQLALIIEDHGGHRLDAVIDRTARLPPESAIAIALEVADALAAVHRRNEPHGALRPELVELTEQGSVYLHGIGQRYVHALRGADEELQQPEHMAPEQLLGDEPDEQTDVFLFGMMLYGMVAGASPFPQDAGDVSHHIRHDRPTSLHALVANLPDGLEEVVNRCLEKRAADRYPDMTSVSANLVRLLRRETALPRDLLVTRALAAGGLASELSAPRERGAERGTSRRLPWRRFVPAAFAVLAVAGIGAAVWSTLGGTTSSGSNDPRGIVKQPARVQVLARPWAEVYVDGALVDVTPIGRPMEVNPGRHTVMFRHPHAPDESRTIEIIAGQTILLDVVMKVQRPAADADASVPLDAGADAQPSP
jgi:eukaryotic-like serine/threonine-protein kinase